MAQQSPRGSADMLTGSPLVGDRPNFCRRADVATRRPRLGLGSRSEEEPQFA